jgi:transposase-like protein
LAVFDARLKFCYIHGGIGSRDVWGALETLKGWVKKADVDIDRKLGLTTDLAADLKTLERENPELRQANESFRKALVYFARGRCEECSPPSRKCLKIWAGRARFTV